MNIESQYSINHFDSLAQPKSIKKMSYLSMLSAVKLSTEQIPEMLWKRKEKGNKQEVTVCILGH